MTRTSLTSRFCYVLLVSAGLAAQPVTAFNAYCDNRPPDPDPDSPKCNDQLVGDPLHMIYGSSYAVFDDATIVTSVGNLPFRRFYHSDTAGVSGMAEAGGAPFGETAASGYPSPEWWHNFYSFLKYEDATTPPANYHNGGPPQWRLFAPNGSMTAWLHAGSGWMDWLDRTAPGGSPLLADRLYRNTSGTFSYYDSHGARYDYNAYTVIGSTQRYYLSKIFTKQSRLIATVEYEYPSYVTPSCVAGAGDPGVPYIKRVRTVDGQAYLFTWMYLTNYGCALSRVDIEGTPDAGSTSLAASFGYTTGQGQNQLLNTTNKNGSEAYNYSPTQFSVVRNQLTKLSHTLSSTLVTNATGEGQTVTSNYAPTSFTPTCILGTCCTGAAPRSFQVDAARSGDTSGAAVTLERQLTYVGGGNVHRLSLQQRNDSCTASPQSCSQGAEQWAELSCNNSSYFDAYRDKRSAWTVHSVHQDLVGGFQASYPETEYRGATDILGHAALEQSLVTRNINVEPYRPLSAKYFLSSINPPQSATIYYSYATTATEPSLMVRNGWTKDINGNIVARSVGQRYLTSRQCETPGADAYTPPRVLRIEGPCDMPAGGGACLAAVYPVTELHYWPISSSTKSGRLKRVVRFPNGSSCGQGLETVYNDYNAEGMPLSITTPDGVTSTYTYSGTQLRSQTVSGLTTTFGYDAEKLTSIGYPGGNYDIYCYRLGTTNGCQGGNLRKFLQWKAKASDALGVTVAEKTLYTYGTDDTVLYEDRLDPAGNIRLRHTFHNDAQRRPTWEQVGTGSDFRLKRHFDGSDNQDAVGNPFNAAPDFCSSNSQLCTWLTFDRANRLDELDVSYDGVTSSRSCFDYDQQGNVVRDSMGCATGSSACVKDTVVGGVSTCDPAMVDYQTDDFGNVISATNPWRGRSPNGTYGSSAGITRYTYNPMGLVVEKQTQWMRELADPQRRTFSYDQMGRLLSASTVANSATTWLLFTMGYDLAWSGAGCSASSNVGGRLAWRNDSYGLTYYSYDYAGRVLAERRASLGHGCTGSIADNPDTTYSYDQNGNLAGIVYPRGREVSYGYGVGGLRDRVATISTRLASAGVWGALTPIVSAIQWEPYGEVKSYSLATHLGALVEYAREGSPTVVPSASTCALLGRDTTTYDQSSRLRSLWVSRGSTSTGNIMKKVLTWRADLPVRETTCFLSQATPHQQVYSYNRALQLLGAVGSNVPVEFGSTQSTSYGFDLRGNRTTHTRDGVGNNLTFEATTSFRRDYLKKQWQFGPEDGVPTSSQVVFDYIYDSDGRVQHMNNAYALWNAEFGYPGSESYSTAVDGVIRSVSINGATYVYSYDAFGRRRAKDYPQGAHEEFFYDGDHSMLADQSVAMNAGVSAFYQQDDYVWLGGRPIAVVRGRFSLAWDRQDDSSADCSRVSFVGTPACGVYGVVTDQVGKPVLTIQYATGRVAGTGLFDEYGYPNRVRLAAATPVPLPANYSGQVGRIDWSFGASQTVTARALLHTLTTTTGDVTVNGTGNTTGFGLGRVWTPFVSAPTQAVVTANNLNYDGVRIESVEYRRIETGATFWFPPFRFPGQYYDAETELVENWNRYYEPTSGRYLQPEPLLRQPNSVKLMAIAGHTATAYSYAANSPLAYMDPNGLYFVSTSPGAWEALSRLAQNPIIGPYVEAMQTDTSRRFVITDDVPFPYHGGGLTHAYETGSADITIDVKYANSTKGQCSSGQPPSYYPYSYDALLAHELGHAQGFGYSSQPNNAADMAVQWENAVRNASGSAPRGFPHDVPVCASCAP